MLNYRSDLIRSKSLCHHTQSLTLVWGKNQQTQTDNLKTCLCLKCFLFCCLEQINLSNCYSWSWTKILCLRYILAVSLDIPRWLEMFWGQSAAFMRHMGDDTHSTRLGKEALSSMEAMTQGKFYDKGVKMQSCCEPVLVPSRNWLLSDWNIIGWQVI